MPSITNNVYTNKLDDIFHENNNTYHSKIKMELIDVTTSTYIDLKLKVMIKILNLKWVI